MLNPPTVVTETSSAGLGNFPLGTVEPDYVLTGGPNTDPAAVFSDISTADGVFWGVPGRLSRMRSCPHRRLLGTGGVSAASCTAAGGA